MDGSGAVRIAYRPVLELLRQWLRTFIATGGSPGFIRVNLRGQE